ncbi:MAG: hypothetical protein ACI9NC_003482 [Verrucomicrobiales bacterium]|jgi:uncharacterized protein involved in exopolysaccharide biosynthesis
MSDKTNQIPNIPPAGNAPSYAVGRSPEPLVDGHDLKFMLRKDLWIFIAIGAVCLVLGGLSHLMGPRSYESSALIYIDPKFDQIIRYEQLSDSGASDMPSLNSLEVAIMADSMVLRVIDRLDLRDDKTFLPPELDGQPDLKIVRFLQNNRFEAGLLPDTRLIKISVRDPQPERAKRIASTFASEFDQFIVDQRQAEAKAMKVILEAQASVARDAAFRAEDQLRAFREASQQGPVEQDHDIYSNRLTQFSNELNEVVRRRLELESQVEIISEVDIEANPELVIELAGSQSLTHVSDMLSHKMTAEANLAVASTQVTKQNPAYLAALSEKEDSVKQLQVLARDIKTAASSKLAAIHSRETNLRKQVGDLQKGLVEMKSLSSEFRALKQQVEREWQVHETLQQRISESLLAGDSYSNIATEFSKALLPYKKAGPGLVITLIIAAAGAGFLGTGWTVFRILRGFPYSDIQQLTRAYKIPVIGKWRHVEAHLEPDAAAVFYHSLTSDAARITQISAPGQAGIATVISQSAAKIAAKCGADSIVISVASTPERGEEQPSLEKMGGVSKMTITARQALKDSNLENWLQQNRSRYDHIFIDASAANEPSLVAWVARLADQNLIVVCEGGVSKDTVDQHIEQLSASDMPQMKLLVVNSPKRGGQDEPERIPLAAKLFSAKSTA